MLVTFTMWKYARNKNLEMISSVAVVNLIIFYLDNVRSQVWYSKRYNRKFEVYKEEVIFHIFVKRITYIVFSFLKG
jgi:hypothetical protein